MNLHVLSNSLDTVKADTLVLFATVKDKKAQIDCSHKKDLSNLLEDLESSGFSGKAKETLFFRSANLLSCKNVLLVGAGAHGKITETQLRSSAAAASKALAKEKVTSAAVCLETVRKLTKSAEGAGQAIAEGFLLGQYKFEDFKSKPKDESANNNKKLLKEVFFVLKDKAAGQKFNSGLKAGVIVSEYVNFARDLGNYPSNHLTPTILAEKAKEAAKGTGIKVHIFDKAEIKKQKMGSFLAVNKGSEEEPRFIIMEYFGGAKSKAPIVLVGKGITFDTGGISIKPSAGMEEMKFDMCGAATVIATILAIAKLKLKVNVVTLVPSTENMPSGSAIKPGDIVTALNGKTIEINNTDAEGRLILNDALTYGTTHYKPAAIFDVATLTGACTVALGNVYTGLFSQNEKLIKSIQASADRTGEKLWRLPLTEEFIEDMRGTYADLSNMANSAKGGGASHAAGFLSYFIENNVPWAHFDVAGTAWHTGNRHNYNPDKGGTGVLVRMFVDLVQEL